VRESARLVLGDVLDARAEARAVAHRLADLVPGLWRDHDPDLTHASVDERLDPVEQHGLVGDRHELFRRGMRDRAQPRARPAGQNQPLERLHQRREG